MKVLAEVEIKEVNLTPKISSRVIRLKTYVIFPKKESNEMLSYKAIIDTGAPISVIPPFIWKQLKVIILDEVPLAGINKSPECQINSYLGGVLMGLTDEDGSQSPLFSSLAYLSHQSDIPLVLGYDRCLEYFHLEADMFLVLLMENLSSDLFFQSGL